MLDLAEVSWVISFISRLLNSVRMIRKTASLSLKHAHSLPRGLAPSTGSSVVSPLERKGASALRPSTCDGDGAGRSGGTSAAKRKRPARLVIPESRPEFGGCTEDDRESAATTAEGSGYCVAGKKGRRHATEDGYAVITNISEDPKQAFFGVFDGHGGRGAVDFVTEKLGKNIVSATQEGRGSEKKHAIEEAIKAGYLDTDKQFLKQGVRGGACVATVLVKDGALYTANTGDCRVVLSRDGVAVPMTRDHRLDQREDEQDRIRKLGGYVDCINGVWRVQGSLAVSRSIGDLHLKEWVISEPEVCKIELSSDCQFLVMASDGLWDKVNNQEAVEVILKNGSRIESCKRLVDLSFGRGNKDDTTVMVVDLEQFK
ncbi:unnamed protein product [Victoria cruziana]